MLRPFIFFVLLEIRVNSLRKIRAFSGRNWWFLPFELLQILFDEKMSKIITVLSSKDRRDGNSENLTGRDAS